MRILFVASECVPFAKTGGLADVMGALPKCIAKMGHEVDVLIPRYRKIPIERLTRVVPQLSIPLGGRLKTCSIWRVPESAASGEKTYFVDCPEYFDRDEFYGEKGVDFPDNAERFALFSRAAIEFARQLPTPPDLFHCHDWQSALIPVILKHEGVNDRFFEKTRTVFTIHNMGYQGLFDATVMKTAGLPDSSFHLQGLEFYGKVNYLKGGIAFADAITTVSVKYSREIQTAEFGHGLEGVVRSRAADVHGILNGIDYADWSPAVDRFIIKNYTPESLDGKLECKLDLLQEFHLPEQLPRPLIGIISRLDDQKGFDLISEGIESILALNPMFAVLGSGKPKYESLLQRIAAEYPQQFGLRLAFDNKLAHKIEAGADLFLMPSRYEPCGLNQLYSLKYGTVPVVRATGGLDDTVEHFNPSTGQGTGFKFHDYTATALSATVREALETYKNREAWRRLMRAGMAKDFSWNASAGQYVQLYETLRSRKPR
ncbi:MAG: glycogen synthase GlgA [Terriglobia bacterium]